jgi:oxygen-independent coproporphyrinogen-3 oxidase
MSSSLWAQSGAVLPTPICADPTYRFRQPLRYIAVTQAGCTHLYVHIPFCARRCSYCDFAIAVRRVIPVSEYIGEIAAELKTRLAGAQIEPLSTIYLGGGTPSKLGADGVRQLLSGLSATPGITVQDGAEITMEANPEDVSYEAAAEWAKAGINRVSLGVQSFHAVTLAWMHRTHDVDAAGRAMTAAREAGINNISMDLIFALPSDLERNWDSDLSKALALHPDHISLYGLTVEPHTPLGRWTARGEVAEAPEERYAEEFLRAHKVLSLAGFEHYEVSNFHKSGKASRHNSSYWQRAPYIGLGPSAHSFDGTSRRWNEREYEPWRTKVAAGADPLGGSEQLTPENVLAEEVYLGLRTSNGLSVTDVDTETIATWEKSAWAVLRKDRVTLTAEGWLRLDSLAAALTAARSH